MIQTKQGLTLIESLVSLSVLMVVLAASTITIQGSFKDKRFAADQSVATYLATDAVERVRQIRDNSLIVASNNNSLSNTFWDNLPDEGYYFIIDDTQSDTPQNQIKYCSNTQTPTSPSNTAINFCDVMVRDIQTNRYQLQTNNSTDIPQNSFRRYHRVETDSTTTKKQLLTVVEWKEGTNINRYETLNEFANVNPPTSSPVLRFAGGIDDGGGIFDEDANPQYSDGIDNDSNGFTDFSGDDPGCSSANDPIEATYQPTGGEPPVAPSFVANYGAGDNLLLVPQRGVNTQGSNVTGIVDSDQDISIAHTISHPFVVLQKPAGVTDAEVQPNDPHVSASFDRNSDGTPDPEYRVRWAGVNALTTPGFYEFEYTVTDDTGLTDTGTIQITVNATQYAAVDDTLTITYDTSQYQFCSPSPALVSCSGEVSCTIDVGANDQVSALPLEVDDAYFNTGQSNNCLSVIANGSDGTITVNFADFTSCSGEVTSFDNGPYQPDTANFTVDLIEGSCS